MKNIVTSATPYRVSFAGGISDIEEYFDKYGGYVVSTTIDKYIYITVHRWKEKKYRIIYSKIENVEDVEDIQHPLIKECIKYVGIEDPLEIVSLASVRGNSGLGSSSSFTVGLLNALYRLKGRHIKPAKLAEDACEIEVSIVGESLGFQDQYAAAYGGLNSIEFNKDYITVNPIYLDDDVFKELQSRLLLFSTDIKRRSSGILFNYLDRFDEIKSYVDDIKQLAYKLDSNLTNQNIINLGNILDKEWNLKKKTGHVSNTIINDMYKRAIDAGATGGKICGAGAGGYLLVCCDKNRQNNVRYALRDYKELLFNFEEDGSRIIYEE